MKRIGFVALALACPAVAQAETEVSPPDLPTLIECRAEGVPAYNQLAFALTSSERGEREQVLARYGLTQEDSGNPLLEQYRLATPIAVFGRQTARIAFVGAGLLAIFDEADPHPLAKQLGVTPAIDARGKYLGEKIVTESEEKLEGDVTLRTHIALNVSTVDSHPGKTLAGCTYRIDTD